MPIFPHIFPVTSHTNFIGVGSIFIAIKGHNEDGVKYIRVAVKKGATKIIIKDNIQLAQSVKKIIERSNIELEYVANTRLALAQLSACYAGNPAKKIKIIGITGTKGKTTTAYILEHILKYAGKKTALLSTIKNKIGNHEFETELTTQQPDYLHQFFKLCVQEQVEYVVMEVAAQAISLHRVAGIAFDGIIFTNFDQEHAEFYKTQEEYFQAKCELFNQIKPDAPVLINVDDKKGKKIVEQNKKFLSFSLKKTTADFFARCDTSDYGISAIISEQYKQYKIACGLIGIYNSYNCLGALSMASCLGIATETIAKALSAFSFVPGRFEQYETKNGVRFIIDYAHNPSSFRSILSLLAGMTDHLIVVFGAGGQRDKIKRPLMGEIASKYADMVIVTSDNPRNEDPQSIIDDIYMGILSDKKNNVFTEIDRKKAIIKAFSHAKYGTIIALLGKGPDEYQQIGSKKIFFSEKEIINSLS